MKDLLKQYPQEVQLIVRYMLYHQNSRLAAMATEAAGKQGKYWEMQEILFTRTDWTHQAAPQTERAYARLLDYYWQSAQPRKSETKRMPPRNIRWLKNISTAWINDAAAMQWAATCVSACERVGAAEVRTR